jgi:murein DD-endopeptidase MepM/ murein hydrolase activator NlpD
MALGLEATGQKKNKMLEASASASANAARISAQASELMASRITPVNVETEALALEKMEAYNRQIAAEARMFPADALYGSNWDTIHVNPFERVQITFPDSYTIDCRSFVMPLDHAIKVNSKYGPRRRRMHRGIDLDLEKGDSVRVAFDGKVRIKSYERRGYGYYVVVRHPNGLETVYGHLSKILVRENQILRAGQVIALGGNTGRSTGAHLHFETRFLGKDLDPADIIDFENRTPHRDEFVFTNIKINGKKSNIYSTSADATIVHRVRSGETLSHIARKYGTSVAELCKLNGITKTSKLQIGQGLHIRSKQVTVEANASEIARTPSEQPKTVAKQSSANASASQKASPAATSSGKKIEAPVIQSEAPEGATIYHSIQPGETLYYIANKYNITIEKLCELNNIQDNTILKPGKKLRCS